MAFKNVKNKKGYILVTVMVFIAMVSILCATMATVLTAESSMVTARDETVTAAYAAQAGMDHLFALMMNDYSVNVWNYTVVMKNENGEKIYYTISRRINITSAVSSIGCYEKNGQIIKTVTITGNIDQHGNITMVKQT